MTMSATPARPPGSRFRDMFSVTGTATQIDQITRRMRRIRIEGDDISRLAWVPGQHVRVLVSDIREPRNWLRLRDMLRTYSVWNRAGGGIELCVLDHEEGGPGRRGPGAEWARGLRAGDPVSVTRPEGSLVLREGSCHVFAGDETAAVAFGPMLRARPPAASVFGVIEADDPEDRLPLGDQLNWVYRNGRPAAASQSLLAALAELPLPSEPGVAYLAGEARTIQLLRRHLVAERGWPRQAVITKPFWTPGKKGMD